MNTALDASITLTSSVQYFHVAAKIGRSGVELVRGKIHAR